MERQTNKYNQFCEMRYNKGKEITKIIMKSHIEIYSKEYKYPDKVDQVSEKKKK